MESSEKTGQRPGFHCAMCLHCPLQDEEHLMIYEDDCHPLISGKWVTGLYVTQTWVLPLRVMGQSGMRCRLSASDLTPSEVAWAPESSRWLTVPTQGRSVGTPRVPRVTCLLQDTAIGLTYRGQLHRPQKTFDKASLWQSYVHSRSPTWKPVTLIISPALDYPEAEAKDEIQRQGSN
ncbi:hypothetical protein EYF80_045452 [Liparis tanakae]|uniref:Uncharacterized protein n=1 Tax=Liparis tanakae TaxID=230148 RepID=A0A4Z2FSZ0_9TELE|nr:hypothetical protein EYF80_045452 [Liparis tanakae]